MKPSCQFVSTTGLPVRRRGVWMVALALAGGWLAWGPRVDAQVVEVSLGAARDTSIFANNVNNSGGGSPGLFSGTNGVNSTRRALLGFDFTSIPAGSLITEVELTLTLALVAGGSPGSATIRLFEMTRNWGEGTAGSSAPSVSGTGNGFAAAAGDATWSAAASGSTVWTTPGGDFAPTASASLLLSGTAAGSLHTWSSTPALVADVQGWVDNPATNFGWALVNANETTASSLYAFYSSEWRSFPGGSAAQEPVLRVTYAVPEPGAALLGGCGWLLLSCHRRRHARTA